MKKVNMTPRDFVTWFAKTHPIDGKIIDFVQTSSGRKILFDDMTDEDANFVANQFMLMMASPEGQA